MDRGSSNSDPRCWIVTKVVGFPLAGTFLIFWAYFFFGAIWAAASGRRDFNPFEGVGGTLLLAAPVLFLLGCGYCWRAGAERLLPTGRRYGAKAWIA